MAEAPVSFSHTFELKVSTRIKGMYYFTVENNSGHFWKPLYSGGPRIWCYAAFSRFKTGSDLHYESSFSNHPYYFEFTISWPEEVNLRCSTEVYLTKGDTRWSRGNFNCCNGTTYELDIHKKSIRDSFVEEDKTFTIFIDVKAERAGGMPLKSVFHHNAMLADCAKMFDNDLYFPDVEVVCGGRTFKCHKSLLAARSDVFAPMFSGGFREGMSNVVVIHDMEPDVAHSMLLYIYSGAIEEQNVSTDLFRAAHLYRISLLAKACSLTLASKITVDNCCEILEMAHLYDDRKLFDNAIAFFKKHKGVLMRTPWFERRIETNFDLLNKILLRTYR